MTGGGRKPASGRHGQQHQTSEGENPSLGILLMAGSALILPVVDGTAKYLGASFSPLMIAWARYLVASALVLPLALWRFGWPPFPRQGLAAHVVRTVCLVSSMTLFFVALGQVDLATAVTAYFSAPILAMLLSVVFLGESLTRAKLISLALGAAGTLIVVRPFDGIQPGALMAVAAGVFYAVYLVATRQASRQGEPLRILAFQSVVGTLLLTPQAVATFVLPPVGVLWLFLLLGAVSALSHMMMIAAFRHAEASTLAPLVYLELVGASLFGFLVFADTPDTATILGAGFIVAAGLILQRAGSASRPQP